MTIKIIGALLLVGFFFMLSKVGMAMVGKENPLAKAFPKSKSSRRCSPS